MHARLLLMLLLVTATLTLACQSAGVRPLQVRRDRPSAGMVPICPAGTYFYNFTNNCAQPIFVGQNGPGPSVPPSFPEKGNWALAPACKIGRAHV